MRVRWSNTLLALMIGLVCLFLFAGITFAAPPDPYANDPGDTNPVPTSGFQGWEVAEIQVPDPTANNTTSVAQGDVTFDNYWYAVGSWGTSPSDGRMALYIDYFDNPGTVAINLGPAEWLSGVNIAYNAQEGYYDAYDGAYLLYNLTASNFVSNNPTWMGVPSPPSGRGNGDTWTLPTNLGSDPNNPNPQYLNSTDNDASQYYVKWYWDNPNGAGNPGYWLFNPQNGIYQGNGQSPGWFGDYQIYPPDIQIALDAGNENQPVAAGTKVTGSFVVKNPSAYTWQNIQATLYLADANGNILSTIATIPNLSITSKGSYPGTFQWTMPTNQPNGVEIVAAVDETVGSNITQLTHLQVTSPIGMSTYQDYDWSNNLSIVPVPLAQSSGSGPALVVTPATANVLVSQTQQYTATYYPNGEAAGNGQNVTTQSTWSSANTGIAAVVPGPGSTGGLATGVSTGTTGITAWYNGLSGSAQINVAQGVSGSGYNLSITNLDIGDSSGVTAGNSYTAKVTFSSTFPWGGQVRVDWYQQNAGGQWDELVGSPQYISIQPDSTGNTATIQWTYPTSDPASVTIEATIDYDMQGIPTSNPVYQPLPFPPSGGTTLEYDAVNGNDPDNWKQASAEAPGSGGGGPLETGESDGQALVPIQTTQTITVQVPYTYWTTSWTQVPIIPGPTQTWSPPHYYLSY